MQRDEVVLLPEMEHIHSVRCKTHSNLRRGVVRRPRARGDRLLGREKHAELRIGRGSPVVSRIVWEHADGGECTMSGVDFPKNPRATVAD